MLANVYSSISRQAEAGGREVQSHPCLQSEFEVSLGYMGPCPTKAITEKQKQTTTNPKPQTPPSSTASQASGNHAIQEVCGLGAGDEAS